MPQVQTIERLLKQPGTVTIDQLKKHGGKYSKTFTNDKGLWNTDFEGMATKTVIKLLHFKIRTALR
jgi:recombinational DNA repair protein RecT